MIDVHGIASLLLALGLIVVSGYGLAALHRFRRCHAERAARRAARLITAAWLGLVANQLHTVFVDPAFLPLQPASWRARIGASGPLLMLAETGILMLLWWELRRRAPTG